MSDLFDLLIVEYNSFVLLIDLAINPGEYVVIYPQYWYVYQ